MGKIIASTYEVKERIGSGGAGIVYLGRHLRLGIPVVLKEDKRTLSAKPETLRREVDALKNLNHTYIPQVYDFVIEDETVYTVMAYIEGESLDKPLRRGEKFHQAQVIAWACQLLEALSYLHSRPPYGILHSDIKPANIMLTPQGDIRLIDFNIALALGEEGTVRVGYSRGYASPEHYGLDYSNHSVTVQEQEQTELLNPTPELLRIRRARQTGSSTTGSGRRAVLLDVRSDIYGLGATLYHLLTGQRPPEDAKEVPPITSPDIAPAVAVIVQKAMAPDPDGRYQTAQEMLYAFEHLHENDPRAKRHRRSSAVTAAVLSVLFLAGGACTFAGLKQMERAQAEIAKEARLAEEAERLSQQALKLTVSSENAYRAGDLQSAAQSALEALSLDSPYAVRARKALTDALGVYDLSDGYKSHLLVSLPSEPLKVALSPEGRRAAVMVTDQVLVFDTGDGRQLAALAAGPSALADVVFPSEDVMIYAGEGAIRAYDIVRNQELWSGKAATGIALSGDGTVAAGIYKDENLATIYDAASGAVKKTVSFQDQHQSAAVNDTFADIGGDLFALNKDGTLLAVSFSSGSLKIFDLRDSAGDMEIFDPSDFGRYSGGFFEKYFAFSAKDSEQAIFAVVDTEEMVQTGGSASTQVSYMVQPDDTGLYVASENILVKMHPVTGEQQERAYTDGWITAFDTTDYYTITVTDNGAVSFFDAQGALLNQLKNVEACDFAQIAGECAVLANSDSPTIQVLHLENHSDAQIAVYDRDYGHNEARFSTDGNTFMLFRFDGFRICDTSGRLIAEAELPDSGQIYDQQFRRDSGGGRLEVTYYSGLVRTYSAADGSLLSETAGDPPDEGLYEEFFTDKLRITAPSHGSPIAYDRETGEMVSELEPDDYLTYVTQVDEYIVTEYMNAQGERYGLLLDGECQILARLPQLCDVMPDGTLIFDDMKGNLRQSRIYSMQELTALAQSKTKGESS